MNNKKQIELAHPNWRYVAHINNSANYLNCPKHLLNEWLFHNARQTKNYTKEQRVGYVLEILKKYACQTKKEFAVKIVEQFENLSFDEMKIINPNNFRDDQPMPSWMAQSIENEKRYWERFGIFGVR